MIMKDDRIKCKHYLTNDRSVFGTRGSPAASRAPATICFRSDTSVCYTNSHVFCDNELEKMVCGIKSCAAEPADPE